jgi:flagellar biosynthesis protein
LIPPPIKSEPQDGLNEKNRNHPQGNLKSKIKKGKMEKYFVKKAAALKYDRKKNNAPNLTAYGTNGIAKNIIKVAEENNIPIKQDEDLVNMLSELELNQEIPVELYQTVAEVFKFIYAMANEKIH